MLKWAVNGSHIRHSHHNQTIQFDDNQNDYENNYNHVENSNNLEKSINPRQNSVCHMKREKLRRKSSGNEFINNRNRNKILINNKENHLTSSTPLQLTKQINNNNNNLLNSSPLRKLDSLKDLSNIKSINESFMVVTPSGTINQTPIQQKYSDNSLDLITTPNTLIKNNNPLQYATTLPTFDVEYSPCGIIPGPLLALRGISIADSYFEKPRYLPHEFPGYRSNSIKRSPNTNNNNNNNNQNSNQPPPAKRFHAVENIDECKINGSLFNNNNNYDESLSSSKMGDTTLNKMIDAILESARKDRRIPKSKQNQLNHIMSPTYTPADDPASDLNEFWDEPNSIYRQNIDKNIKNYNFDDPGGTILYNEREIRTPDNYYFNNLFDNLPNTSNHHNNINKNNNNNISCHLRRQRAVRRKRKLSMASTNFLKSTVKNSAQKIFSAHNILLHKNHNDENHNQLLNNQNENNQQKKNSKIDFSPDSGRNSASDFDDSNDENHCTKRRLSLSPDV